MSPALNRLKKETSDPDVGTESDGAEFEGRPIPVMTSVELAGEADARQPNKISKKRKRSTKASHRRKLRYEAYVDLLNQQIHDASARNVLENVPFHHSQHGVTCWAPPEKIAFFNALSRVGRNDLRAIASAVVTKSELEVYAYSELLRQSTMQRSTVELPAAAEISPECSQILDRTAAFLESKCRRIEEQEEKERWGEDRWLLTPDVADWAAEKLGDGEGGMDELAEILPEALLLRLECWLELSSRVFMNPAMPWQDQNWRNIAEPGEAPAIRYTAFIDFHSLAVEFTKRLIQTAIFCATSRLRSRDTVTSSNEPYIKPVDVHTACQVLRVPHSMDEFWIGAARRNRLEVYSDLSQTQGKADRPSPLSHEEVEQKLGKSANEERSEQAHDPSPDSINLKHANDWGDVSEGDTDSWSSTKSMTSRTTSSWPSAIDAEVRPPKESASSNKSEQVEEESVRSSHSRLSSTKVSSRTLDQAQAENDEAIDREASLLEERRLWAILQLESTSTLPRPDDVVRSEMRPSRQRKRSRELPDWKDRIEYWSEWEVALSALTSPQRPHATALNETAEGPDGQQAEIENTPSVEVDQTTDEETSSTSDEIMHDHPVAAIEQDTAHREDPLPPDLPRPPTRASTPALRSSYRIAASIMYPQPVDLPGPAILALSPAFSTRRLRRIRNAPPSYQAMGMIPTASAIPATLGDDSEDHDPADVDELSDSEVECSPDPPSEDSDDAAQYVTGRSDNGKAIDIYDDYDDI